MAQMVLVGGPYDGKEMRSDFANPASTSIAEKGKIAFYHSRIDWENGGRKRDRAGRVMMYFTERKPEAAK